MTENNIYNTFRLRNDSSTTLLLCKKRTENGAQYIKTLTVLCTIEVEWWKRRGFSQRYTDHRQQNSWIELKIMRKKPNSEGKVNLPWPSHLSHREFSMLCTYCTREVRCIQTALKGGCDGTSARLLSSLWSKFAVQFRDLGRVRDVQ